MPGTAYALKRCAGCGEHKPLEQFPKDKSRKDGRMCRCRDCDNARSRNYYAAHRDATIQRVQTRQSKRPARKCLSCKQPATSNRHWFCDTCRAQGARRSDPTRHLRPLQPPLPPMPYCLKCGGNHVGEFERWQQGLRPRIPSMALHRGLEARHHRRWVTEITHRVSLR